MRRSSMNCTCDKQCVAKWARNNKLLLVTAVGIVVGIILGFAVRAASPSETTIGWIAIWGDLFLRMIKMVILPMIVSSLVVGIASLSGKASGKMGAISLGYIFGTNLIGCTAGLILVISIHPGSNLGDAVPTEKQLTAGEGDVLADLLRNLVPENIVQACFQQLQTTVKEVELNASMNATTVVKSLQYIQGMNIIGIISFSVLLGVMISLSQEKGKPLFQLLESLHHVTFKMMMTLTWFSPVGITSMIAAAILRVENFAILFQSLGMFVFTVTVGILIYTFLLIPLLIFVLTRKNPFRILVQSLEAIFLAVGPPSSMAAMPGLFNAMEEKRHIDSRVTNFFIPIAVTLIRGGSSVFICIGVLFVAQTYGIKVGVGSIFTVGLLVLVLSCAVAAVPSSSLVILLMVSSAIGVPVTERLGLLMSVDWLLDRLRTAANVSTEACGSVVLYHFCKKDLQDIDRSFDTADDGLKDAEGNFEWNEETKLQKTALTATNSV